MQTKPRYVVVLVDESGRELEPHEVRAGMFITQTDYSHSDARVECRVRDATRAEQAAALAPR